MLQVGIRYSQIASLTSYLWVDAELDVLFEEGAKLAARKVLERSWGCSGMALHPMEILRGFSWYADITSTCHRTEPEG